MLDCASTATTVSDSTRGRAWPNWMEMRVPRAERAIDGITADWVGSGPLNVVVVESWLRTSRRWNLAGDGRGSADGLTAPTFRDEQEVPRRDRRDRLLAA